MAAVARSASKKPLKRVIWFTIKLGPFFLQLIGKGRKVDIPFGWGPKGNATRLTLTEAQEQMREMDKWYGRINGKQVCRLVKVVEYSS